MLIIGSVTLNLSTCYENAACAIQGEEGQESTAWLRGGQAPSPPWLAGTETPTEAARGSRAGKAQRSQRAEDELCPHTE